MTEGGTGGARRTLGCVLFDTVDRFVPEDTDDARDIYANVDGVTRLVSTGLE